MDLKEDNNKVESTLDNLGNNSEKDSQAASIKPKKNKKPLIIVLIAGIIALAIGGFFAYKYAIKPANLYKEANAMYAEKNYAEAKIKYSALGNYKDSAVKVIECDYAAASDALARGDYDSAKQIFDTLSGYKDADDMSKECEYQKASSILNAGDYDSAKKIFDNLSGYNDADDMSKECEYRKAMLLYDGNSQVLNCV